jgi:uncharacterized coiled-coil protein SlyX
MTEVKTQIGAEAQTTNQSTTAGAELTQTIVYLAEREANLSKYSDKLRESLGKIANQFGSADECVICGNRKSAGTAAGNGENYGKHMSGAHAFKPKIVVSIRVQDTEPFNADETDEAVKTLVFDGTVQIGFGQGGFMQNRTIDEVSRYTLKQLVKSGRLPKFLAYVAEKLQEAENEYKEVAEAAEKMAASLTEA